jgi:PadR family transcriptional regulator, regulatory protein PadR
MRDLEVEILEILRQASTHVYELKRLLESRNIQKSHNDLYRTMKSLEKRGLVSREAVPSTMGPERKIYTLTEQGKDSLENAYQGGITLMYRNYLQRLALQVREQLMSELEFDSPPERALLALSPFTAHEGDPFIAAARDLTSGSKERFLVGSGEGAVFSDFISLEAKMQHLPFPDEHFDLIIAPYLAATQVEAALDELSRVLRPDGQVITLLPFATEAVENSLLVEFLVGEIAKHHPHLPLWSRIDFIRELDSYFHVMSIHYRECSLFICRREAL